MLPVDVNTKKILCVLDVSTPSGNVTGISISTYPSAFAFVSVADAISVPVLESRRTETFCVPLSVCLAIGTISFSRPATSQSGNAKPCSYPGAGVLPLLCSLS